MSGHWIESGGICAVAIAIAIAIAIAVTVAVHDKGCFGALIELVVGHTENITRKRIDWF
jgi:hypothetical protein